MKLRVTLNFLVVTAALLLIASAVYLLAGSEAAAGLYGKSEPEKNYPSPSLPIYDPFADQELIFYPKNPAPGDFVIVEAGPAGRSGEDGLELLLDFNGTVSDFYRVGNLIYAIVGICYTTEPGRYSLTLEPVSAASSKAGLEAAIDITVKDFSLSRFSMPPGTTAGWTAARLAEDREKVRIAREATEPHPLWVQTFVPPLEGRITSEYGAIRIINNNPPRRHSGIDLGAEEGTPVFSPNRGLVRLAEFLLSGGNTVIIDHGMGLSSTYMHLENIAVEVGHMVERGELIGTVGMTGYATGPHLHWEVNIGQRPVNPEQLMQNELLWIPPAYVQQLWPDGR